MTKLVNKSGPIQFNLPNGDKSPIFQNGDKAAEWYVNHYPLSGYHITPTSNIITQLPEVVVSAQAPKIGDQQIRAQIMSGNYMGKRFTPTDKNIKYYLNLYDKDKQVHKATDSSEWAKFAAENAAAAASVVGAPLATVGGLVGGIAGGQLANTIHHNLVDKNTDIGEYTANAWNKLTNTRLPGGHYLPTMSPEIGEFANAGSLVGGALGGATGALSDYASKQVFTPYVKNHFSWDNVKNQVLKLTPQNIKERYQKNIDFANNSKQQFGIKAYNYQKLVNDLYTIHKPFNQFFRKTPGVSYEYGFHPRRPKVRHRQRGGIGYINTRIDAPYFLYPPELPDRAANKRLYNIGKLKINPFTNEPYEIRKRENPLYYAADLWVNSPIDPKRKQKYYEWLTKAGFTPVDNDNVPIRDLFLNKFGETYRIQPNYDGITLQAENDLDITKIDPKLVSEWKDKLQQAVKDIPGFQPYGSSVGVSEQALPMGITPHDIDGVIPFNMLPKGAEPRDSRKLTYIYHHPNLGDIDLNVIKIDPNTGVGNERTIELYTQLFPDEYHKQTMDMVTNPNRESYKTYPIRILDINGNPMTEEQLMSRYNALKKTIQDSFEIEWDDGIKEKHRYRPLYYIAGNQPQVVHEVLQNIARKELGENGKLLPKLKFGTPKENQALLESIGYTPYIAEQLSTQPEKIQNALDYWYLADNTLFRAVNAGDANELGGTPQKVIRNLTQWNPVAGGGSESGEGLNTTVGGWSGHTRDVSGLLQPRIQGLQDNMSAKDAIALVRKNIESNGTVSKEQSEALSKIYPNVIIPEGTSLDQVLSMLKPIEEWTPRMRAYKFNKALNTLGVRGLNGGEYEFTGLGSNYYGVGKLNPTSDAIGVNTGDIANNYTFKQIPYSVPRINEEIPEWVEIAELNQYNRNEDIPKGLEKIISRLYEFRPQRQYNNTPKTFVHDRKNQLQTKANQNRNMMWNFNNKWLGLKRGEQQMYSNMLDQLRQNLTNQAIQGAQSGAVRGSIANSETK